MQQADVVWQPEPSAELMPARAVEFQDRMRAGGDERADRGQVQVHRIRVGIWQHQPGTDAARWADGTKDVGPIVTTVTWRDRAAALLGPDVGQAALLADTGFVLQP